MIIFRLHTFLLVAGCVFISACAPGTGENLDSNGFPDTGNTENPTPAPTPASTSFAAIQADIFTPNCALSGCHSGVGPPEGLLLEEGFSYAYIVNQPSNRYDGAVLILPNNPDYSYLIQKLEGGLTGSIKGSQMPKDATPLSPVQIQAIRDWVTEGALDN